MTHRLWTQHPGPARPVSNSKINENYDVFFKIRPKITKIDQIFNIFSKTLRGDAAGDLPLGERGEFGSYFKLII